MINDSFKVRASDGLDIHVHEWLPENCEIKGFLYIVHGMLEHGGRFESWAKRFVDKGFAVYADDHRGHGITAGKIENLGYFADERGAELVVEDSLKVEMAVREKAGDKPFFLMGHSMGSFIVRNMMTAGHEYSGVLLSGTKMAPSWQLSFFLFLIKFLEFFVGKRGSSRIFHNFGMTVYNRKIAKKRTNSDWLTRKDEIVDIYMKDSLCGTTPSIHYYYDLMTLLKMMIDKNRLKNSKTDVPLLIYAGKKDPVGLYGKEVKKSALFYKENGYNDVTLKLYDGARHEMHNEINADECFKDVLCWINSKIS